MHLRRSFVLTSLFAVTACPPSDSTTTDDPATSDGPTATMGESGTATGEQPTTGAPGPGTDTTADPSATTTTDEPATTTDTTDATTDPTATTGEPAGLVESCAELHAQDPGAGDGEYTLYVGKDPQKPWTVYCHDMAGTPKDYLVLVNVEAGRNFSQYTTEGPGTTVHTDFTRVRIDPKTLVVDIDDVTFSESTGMLMHGQTAVTSMPYGVAEGCDGPFMANGLANVDLVGTPFKMIDPFCTKGASAGGQITFSAGDQVVDLTGGGNCGWTGPTKGDMCVFDPQTKNSGFVLELEYIGAQPFTPETCADIQANDPGAADGEYELYVGGDPEKPWPAYCRDMAGTPKEYLVLVSVVGDRNFSQYTASDPEETDLRTNFTRVRIDPITLVVDIDDLTFSTSMGLVNHGGPVMSMPYAVAEGCAGGGVADGVANVDLVGTPFKVIDPFCTKGSAPAGAAVFSSNDQVVDLTGGGNCGWTGPTKGDMCVFDPQKKNSGFVLELEYIGAQPFTPETCADVKAAQPDAVDGEYELYVGGDEAKPWTAHCKDIATTPIEYLTLPSQDDGQNYSRWNASQKTPGTDLSTRYLKVRIDPISLVVDIDDAAFTITVGEVLLNGNPVTDMPYGVAAGCAGGGVADGVANINLVGTPFKVNDTFCIDGFMPAGDAVLSAEDQIVDLTGGGDCGWSGPKKGNACLAPPQMNNGFTLELEYAP